jgi:transcriptional regulator of heat shock response
MDDRLKKLFRLVVDDFVATAEPVGSQRLVDQYGLEVSSATVRNWFAELEEAGLIHQPHTSGGRIPTEKGYREYVAQFVERKPAAKRDRDLLEKTRLIPEEDGRRVKAGAKLLAELSGQAAFAGVNEADTFYTGISQLFAQPEFKDWQRVVSLTEILDRLDETLLKLRRRPVASVEILVGSDCPFGKACSAILIAPKGNLLGILGPVRMDYQHAVGLLTTVADLLND